MDESKNAKNGNDPENKPKMTENEKKKIPGLSVLLEYKELVSALMFFGSIVLLLYTTFTTKEHVNDLLCLNKLGLKLNISRHHNNLLNRVEYDYLLETNLLMEIDGKLDLTDHNIERLRNREKKVDEEQARVDILIASLEEQVDKAKCPEDSNDN